MTWLVGELLGERVRVCKRQLHVALIPATLPMRLQEYQLGTS